nr:MAG TPA: hypothetical protein [Caudoviricetes sp.]
MGNPQYIQDAVDNFEDLYDQIRDMRDGYHGGDMPGAIEKLYRQVIDMMEGN